MKLLFIQFICLFIAIFITSIYLNKQTTKNKKIEIKTIENMVLKFDNESINLILNNNQTVKSLFEKLPIKMKINKKFEDRIIFKIDKELNIKTKKENNIKKGEIVLDENNNMIIFLESMECNKEYSKIGQILLINKLDDIKKIEEETVILDKR